MTGRPDDCNGRLWPRNLKNTTTLVVELRDWTEKDAKAAKDCRSEACVSATAVESTTEVTEVTENGSGVRFVAQAAGVLC